MASKSRRKARSTSLKALFAMDVGGRDTDQSVQEAVDEANLDGDSKLFVERMVKGVEERRAEIDEHLAEVVTGYSLDRLAAVDRSLLRLASFELLAEDTPTAVVINEAVELAKEYSTEESGGFVNGVLSQMARRVRPEA